MNSKLGGIYSITSKVNGKRYIGSSATINTRWKNHKQDLKDNRHHSDHLQKHYNKYGEDDLLFTVVEIIERGELPLQDFKNLLLQREQTYLDNWKECHFNCTPTAGSTLGCKHVDAKYYYPNKGYYYVKYNVLTKNLTFGQFKTEQEAINQVNFIKTLTEQEQFDYYLANYKGVKGNRQGTRNKRTKGYFYRKHTGKWVVQFTDNVTNKQRSYGSYETEEEAKARAIEVKKQLGGFDI